MLTVIIIVALIVVAGIAVVVARLRVDWTSTWTADPTQPTASVIEALASGPGDPIITIKDSTEVAGQAFSFAVTDVEADTRPSGAGHEVHDVGAEREDIEGGEAEAHAPGGAIEFTATDGGSTSRLVSPRVHPDPIGGVPVADPETGPEGGSVDPPVGMETPGGVRRTSTPVTPRKLPTPRSKHPQPPQWKKWNADLRWNGMTVEDEL